MNFTLTLSIYTYFVHNYSNNLSFYTYLALNYLNYLSILNLNSYLDQYNSIYFEKIFLRHEIISQSTQIKVTNYL